MNAHLAAVAWSQGFEDAWTRTATFVPKLIGCLLILGLGYLVAKAVATAVDKVLERSGFDRAVERGGIRSALAKSRYDASDLVSKLVLYGMMLFVLQLAFGVFGANPVSDLIGGVIAFLPKLFAAIVIIVVAAAMAAAVKDIVASSLSGLGYGRALATAASVSILVIGGFMALSQIQIAPAIVNALFYAALAVIAGSAIIAVGGGGIQPMRARWERALQRWDDELPRVRREVEASRTRREIDLREQAAAPAEDTTAELPSSSSPPNPASTAPGETTQDRIRAEVRSGEATDRTMP